MKGKSVLLCLLISTSFICADCHTRRYTATVPHRWPNWKGRQRYYGGWDTRKWREKSWILDDLRDSERGPYGETLEEIRDAVQSEEIRHIAAQFFNAMEEPPSAGNGYHLDVTQGEHSSYHHDDDKKATALSASEKVVQTLEKLFEKAEQ